MRGNWSGTGRKRIRNVMFTFCKSLLPVMTGTFLGCERMSKIIGRWTHGIKKCVPSPTTPCLIPWKRSKITARWPPSTRNGKEKNRIKSFHWTLFWMGCSMYHYIMPNWQRRQPMQCPSPIARFCWIIVPFWSTWKQIGNRNCCEIGMGPVGFDGMRNNAISQCTAIVTMHRVGYVHRSLIHWWISIANAIGLQWIQTPLRTYQWYSLNLCVNANVQIKIRKFCVELRRETQYLIRPGTAQKNVTCVYAVDRRKPNAMKLDAIAEANDTSRVRLVAM